MHKYRTSIYTYMCVYMCLYYSLNIIKSKVAIKLECRVHAPFKIHVTSFPLLSWDVSAVTSRETTKHRLRGVTWEGIALWDIFSSFFFPLPLSKSTLVLRFFFRIPKKIWLSATSMNASRSKRFCDTWKYTSITEFRNKSKLLSTYIDES